MLWVLQWILIGVIIVFFYRLDQALLPRASRREGMGAFWRNPKRRLRPADDQMVEPNRWFPARYLFRWRFPENMAHVKCASHTILLANGHIPVVFGDRTATLKDTAGGSVVLDIDEDYQFIRENEADLKAKT